MNSTIVRLSRTLPLLALALGLSGFGPGGCGPDPQPVTPSPALCDGLGEAACLADSRCAAEYSVVECLCDCAGAGDCRCPCPPGGFAGCRVAAPSACNLITDEAACLARPDCQAFYGGVVLPCAQDSDGKGGCATPTQSAFLACGPRYCAQVLCDIDCAGGMARDQHGCEVCACAPVLCGSDSDCPAGESCLFGDTRCPPNAHCLPPVGVCARIDQGCDVDAHCRPGERCVFPAIDCPPNAFCAPPRGTCEPVGHGCLSDGDCGPFEACELRDACMAIGCPPPSGVCMPRPSCLSDADCRPGQYCELTWPRCGNDPTPPTGVCKDLVVCQPMPCLLWCEHGVLKDENGCDTCQCNPGPACASDADCGPGESCTYYTGACPPGAPCPPPGGVCMPREPWCASDADCGPGQRCELVDCPPSADGMDCMIAGRCVPAGCLSDSDCAPGESCLLPDCAPGGDCLGAGTCEARTCGSDADCGPGTSCQPDPTDPCNGPDLYCFQMGRMICLPRVSCFADAECGPGRHCELPLVNCGPMSNCPNPEGRCVDGPRPCLSDGECLGGQVCAMPEIACLPGANCPQPMGVCVEPMPPPCATAADCAPGQVCAPDPDACRDTPCTMMAPLPTVCLPACAGLRETACNYRGDCRAVYGPSACTPDGSTCTADWVFKSCL